MKHIRYLASILAIVTVILTSGFVKKSTETEFYIEDENFIEDDPNESDPDWQLYHVVDKIIVSGSCTTSSPSWKCQIQFDLSNPHVISISGPDANGKRVYTIKGGGTIVSFPVSGSGKIFVRDEQ